MYTVYLEDTVFDTVHRPYDDALPVYIPDKYTKVKSFGDYIKAYEYAAYAKGRAVVVWFNKPLGQIPATLGISDALRLARETLKQVGDGVESK